MRRRHQVMLYIGAAGVLLSVFALYARPAFLITLANQVWTCF